MKLTGTRQGFQFLLQFRTYGRSGLQKYWLRLLKCSTELRASILHSFMDINSYANLIMQMLHI
jgi:hypothetical protein